MSGNDCWNRVCFTCCWKADNELADVTLSGSLLQNCAAATGKAWPPTDGLDNRLWSVPRVLSVTVSNSWLWLDYFPLSTATLINIACHCGFHWSYHDVLRFVGVFLSAWRACASRTKPLSYLRSLQGDRSLVCRKLFAARTLREFYLTRVVQLCVAHWICGPDECGELLVSNGMILIAVYSIHSYRA